MHHTRRDDYQIGRGNKIVRDIGMKRNVYDCHIVKLIPPGIRAKQFALSQRI